MSLPEQAPPAATAGSRRVLLLVFLLAATAIAAVQSYRSRREAIVATPDVLTGPEEERRELLGRALTDAERAKLREDWIDQEVLVREAYRRGLDRGDGVVRHRLIEKMRRLLATRPGEPTEEELRAFHRDHGDRYLTPPRVSLEHVFLGANDQAARDRLEAWRPSLRGGADFRRLGDRFWLGPTLEGVTPAELGRVLGEEFASEVFALEPGGWAGPVPSLRGLHLVRVKERLGPEAVPFEAARTAVREDWYEARERETLRRQIDELKERYRIEAAPAKAVASPPSLS